MVLIGCWRLIKILNKKRKYSIIEFLLYNIIKIRRIKKFTAITIKRLLKTKIIMCHLLLNYYFLNLICLINFRLEVTNTNVSTKLNSLLESFIFSWSSIKLLDFLKFFLSFKNKKNYINKKNTT